MSAQAVVTPNRMRLMRRDFEEQRAKVRALAPAIRAASRRSYAWEVAVCAYAEARYWREVYRRNLAAVVAVKGSAWCEAAQMRLRARGRLK